ncbi:MAG TPA: helix-turn-helix domain-containing GNAT family N-acetyltransferase [Candidatus Acidoferrales bacterium]|nr:helix-turn-helix domain-containing GNAT family N-acetyltransferase [Candidatus Acidoferrales bacterium]
MRQMDDAPTVLDRSITNNFREFNRFYTVLIGSLSREYLSTKYFIQEARVIFEVATAPGCTARQIQFRSGLDQGYLSRLIARLTRSGVIRQRKSVDDRREHRLFLTEIGEAAFRTLDQRATNQAGRLLGQLTPDSRRELCGAFETVRRLLDPSAGAAVISIREQKPGDLGWVFQRHSIIYAEEQSYSPLFEAYVCEGLWPFLKAYDRSKDRLWIGEISGRPAGSIAIHHVSSRVGWAKLRWFFVERDARGRGLGSKLLDTAVRFCRKVGYRGTFLWTVSDLEQARRLYERIGFRLVEESNGCAWAPWAHEQRWELRL